MNLQIQYNDVIDFSCNYCTKKYSNHIVNDNLCGPPRKLPCNDRHTTCLSCAKCLVVVDENGQNSIKCPIDRLIHQCNVEELAINYDILKSMVAYEKQFNLTDDESRQKCSDEIMQTIDREYKKKKSDERGLDYYYDLLANHVTQTKDVLIEAKLLRNQPLLKKESIEKLDDYILQVSNEFRDILNMFKVVQNKLLRLEEIYENSLKSDSFEQLVDFLIGIDGCDLKKEAKEEYEKIKSPTEEFVLKFEKDHIKSIEELDRKSNMDDVLSAILIKHINYKFGIVGDSGNVLR